VSPYASVLHVAELNAARGTYNAGTKPTASAVHDFLEDVAGQIDMTLRGLGYGLPVPTTATSALKLLRGINALGAAWRVEVAAPTSDTEEMYKEMYESALAMVAGGGAIPGGELDIPRDSGQSRPRSNFGTEPGLEDRFFAASMRL